MKVIYVAGKYSGPTHDGKSFTDISLNILEARKWAIEIMKLGKCVTLVPHLNSYHMELDFQADQGFWYNADLELLKRCDAVFLIPNWVDSKGAKIEQVFALDHNIPVFESLEGLKEWLDEKTTVPNQNSI